MIRYSMEIPTSKLASWSSWCDLDFVLAHKVLEDPVYAKHFRERPRFRELIMDNSMHELGHPLPVKDLVMAAALCNATCVIAPDQLGEPEKNLEWYWETVKAFAEQPFMIGAVMCGRTYSERYKQLNQYRGAGMILLPYREDRLKWYLEHQTQIERYFTRVHLLGVNTLRELELFTAISGIHNIRWSMDTAKAVKWGMSQALFSQLGDLRGHPLSSKDLLDLEHISLGQESAVYENVQFLRRICDPVVE